MPSPRVIIGRESLLHYEPNKPGLLSVRGTVAKKGSSQDIAHSLTHHSEKKVSMLEKPIHIMNSKQRSGGYGGAPSFHISLQGNESMILKNAANEVLGGTANKPIGLRNKHISVTYNNPRRF
jgi:hypothetical protein